MYILFVCVLVVVVVPFFQSNEPLDRHIAFGSFHNNTVKSAVSDLCCRRPSTVSDRFSVHRRFHIQTDLSRATICCARPATAISCTVAAFKSAVSDRDPGSVRCENVLASAVRCQLQSVKMRCLASAIDWRLACTQAVLYLSSPHVQAVTSVDLLPCRIRVRVWPVVVEYPIK